MKNVLCFGDSNTWGYNSETKDRFPADIRWTGILSQKLGVEYHIIEEGLNGRTTVWDDPIIGYKNGKEYLIPTLASHRPIDLVIIMLGTNDMKKRFCLPASDIAAGAGMLVEIVQKSNAGYNGKPPKVLLISPIHIGDIQKSEFADTFDTNNVVSISEKLAYYFKNISINLVCEFMDAASIATPNSLDAIHLDAVGHKKLGEEIVEKVKNIIG